MIRNRNALWRDFSFPIEWAMISVVKAAVVLLYWLVLGLFMVEQAAFGLYLIQLIGTVAVYPVMVALSVFVFGVRKVGHGELEALGHRI
jgi:rod shape-determining protein MreD